MSFIKILNLLIAIFLLICGYLIAFRYKYKLISGYQSKKERYPIEIEKKYCRHIGLATIFMGIFFIASLFLDKFVWFYIFYSIGIMLLVLYMCIFPSYIVKKELNKKNNK